MDDFSPLRRCLKSTWVGERFFRGRRWYFIDIQLHALSIRSDVRICSQETKRRITPCGLWGSKGLKEPRGIVRSKRICKGILKRVSAAYRKWMDHNQAASRVRKKKLRKARSHHACGSVQSDSCTRSIQVIDAELYYINITPSEVEEEKKMKKMKKNKKEKRKKIKKKK